MRIAGAGCCLIDSIHMHCSYASPGFRKLLSRERGDGGMIEGGLVFSEDLERFAGIPFAEVLALLSQGKTPDVTNLGGPAVVALIHAAQILRRDGITVSFYGAVGMDDLAQQVHHAVQETPLQAYLKEIPHETTATTRVFADPTRHEGKGERSFVNTIGAAGFFGMEDLPQDFYTADIVLLGGTALVPRLHDELHLVLEKAKENGCLTVVGTVYDFRNEKRNPGAPWPLGGEGSYRNIDLLVTDGEEALRLTNAHSNEEAARKLIEWGIGALIITRGSQDMLVWSGGTVIAPYPLGYLPVSSYMDDLMAKDPSLRKDTTGCGDNFVGGVLVSLAQQMVGGKRTDLDMAALCAWGAASGGFTCTYHGGTFHESYPGQKAELLEPVVRAYPKKQDLGF